MHKVVKALEAKINTIRYYNGINGSIATIKVSIKLEDFWNLVHV